MKVKLNLKLLNNIRLGCIVVMFISLFTHAWQAWLLSVVVWVATYMISLGVIEKRLFGEQVRDKEDDED